MKYIFRQVFRSSNFVIGFAIFVGLLLLVIIYPLIVTDPPLAIIGQGTFFPPGIYVSVYDSIGAPRYTLDLDDATSNRIESKLDDEKRLDVQTWLVANGVPESEIDVTDTEKLLTQWEANYDPQKRIPGMTFAKQRYYQRLDASLQGLLSTEPIIIAEQNPETGTLEQTDASYQTDYANTRDVANVRFLPLGTDNFGRDMLTELSKSLMEE